MLWILLPLSHFLDGACSGLQFALSCEGWYLVESQGDIPRSLVCIVLFLC